MITELIAQINWHSGVLGAAVGAVASGVIFALQKSRLKNELTELQNSQQIQQNHLEQKQLQLEQSQLTLAQLQQDYAEQRDESQHFKTRFVEQEKQAQQYNQFWRQVEAELADTKAALNQRDVDLSTLRSTIEQKDLHFKEQLSHIKESKEQLKKEFENLANQILEEKSQRFKTLNQESIEQLLKPVQGELKGFRDKMELIHVEDLKQRAALKTELLHLQAKSQAITEQADRLSTALQGQKKTQGNWGELMLENVLDSAGLRAGVDYQREVSFNTEDGRLRPDVVVYLPQQRHLVIDAKTSLNAYTRYVNADTELEAQQALKEHVTAVQSRINE